MSLADEPLQKLSGSPGRDGGRCRSGSLERSEDRSLPDFVLSGQRGHGLAGHVASGDLSPLAGVEGGGPAELLVPCSPCAISEERDRGSGLAITGVKSFPRGLGAMMDMKAHLERLLDHAAECAMLAAEAETKEKRELFARLTEHLIQAADDVERAIRSGRPPP
jgi:hypothetical protein